MAWTDYSNTNSNLWDAAIGNATNAATAVSKEDGVSKYSAASTSGAWPFHTSINKLENSYNIPGFDGYYPDGTSNPISGDIGGGGGGGVRPSSGFLYPRGDT